MYKYEGSISRTAGSRPHTTNQDISNIPLPKVLQMFTDVKVIVSNPFIEGKEWFVLQDYYNELMMFGGTINEWFASIGARGLNTTPGEPDTKQKVARFHNLAAHWFTQKPADIDKHPNDEILYEDAKDILVSKKEVDYKRLFNSSLFTVNGYIHRAGMGDEGIYILDGVTTAKVSNEHHSAVLTFDKLSTLKCYDIRKDSILPPGDFARYNENVLINTPFSTKGKSVGIVIGGILHWQSKVVTVVGENLVSLNFEHIDWVSRYFHDRHWLNLSNLAKLKLTSEEDYLTKEEYQSDEVILSWLTDLTQSFWVVFDNDAIQVEQIPMESYNWSGITAAPDNQPIPIQLSNGVLAEPLARIGKRKTMYFTRHHHKHNGVSHTVRYKDESSVAAASMMTKPFAIPKPYWLRISSY